MSNYDKIVEKLDSMMVPNVDFVNYYESHQEDRDNIKRPVDFMEEVFERINGEDRIIGTPMPWSKTSEQFRFRMGEVTMWSGYNGHKKSMVLGYASLQFIKMDEPVCIASFEMKPSSTLMRMMKQACGTSKLDMDDMERFMFWTDKNLWLYDHQGSLSAERLYGVIMYAAQNMKCKHFVIDSLMRVIAGEDNYNAQKDFVTKLCDLAIQLNIHIHLVHHTKKGKEGEVSGRYDAKGSGAISDNIHNSLIVWSNKEKKEEQPDVVVKCDKQREGEWEGIIPLWFREECLQFIQHPDAEITKWC